MVQSGCGQQLLAMEQNEESPRILHGFTTKYNIQHHQPQEPKGPETTHFITSPCPLQGVTARQNLSHPLKPWARKEAQFLQDPFTARSCKQNLRLLILNHGLLLLWRRRPFDCYYNCKYFSELASREVKDKEITYLLHLYYSKIKNKGGNRVHSEILFSEGTQKQLLLSLSFLEIKRYYGRILKKHLW